MGLDGPGDLVQDVADVAAKERQGCDGNHRDQSQDERVLDEGLALLALMHGRERRGDVRLDHLEHVCFTSSPSSSSPQPDTPPTSVAGSTHPAGNGSDPDVMSAATLGDASGPEHRAKSRST